MTNVLYKKVLAIISILSIMLAQSVFAYSESSVPTKPSVSGIYNLSKGNETMCNSIDLDQDFDKLTSDITCNVGRDVSSVKIDCGNGQIKTFSSKKGSVTHKCVYTDSDIEYKAQCLTSKKHTTEAEKITHSNFKCNRRYTFNKEIEKNRKISEENSRTGFENYILNDLKNKTITSISKDTNKILTENKDVLEKNETVELIQNDYLDYILDNNRLEYLKSLKYKMGSQFVTQYPEVLPKTGAPKAISFNKNVTPTYIQKLLPENIGYYAEEYNNDINFWKQGVIEKDRNRNLYIVVPTKGMVIPINKPSKKSDYYNSMKSGQEIDINEYLKDGAAIYAGTETKKFGSLGNPLIYGHSSYFTTKEGDYKTHFQSIINLPKGEEIWVFEKNKSNNEFKRYRYVINESYETEKDDFSILEEKEGRNMTLITCTPIGGTTKRWVLKTTYIDEELNNLQRKIHGSNYTGKYWDGADKVITELTKLPTNEKRKRITELYSRLTKAQSQSNYLEISDFLRYFKTRLIVEYYFDYKN